MVDKRVLWRVLPDPIRDFPADLTATVFVTLLVNIVVFAPVIRDTPLRVPLGLVFVLFIPGYVFIAALFPEEGASPVDAESEGPEAEVEATDEDESQTLEEEATADGGIWDGQLRSGIDGIERVALSFGLSIAIVPLLGLVLNFTPWGIRLVPIMLTVTAFTLVATGLAAIRRWQLPPEERFRVPYREWLAAGRAELFEPESNTDRALNVMLVASILLAVGVVGFAITVPPQGEQFSAIYILTEDEEGENEYVAANYPTEFTLGDSAEIAVGVDNNEHRTVDYTVVLLEQEVERVDNETVVLEQTELDRFETQLAHNESWLHPHDLEPTMTGEDIRIVWLLFPDEVPADPSTEETEYYTQLWVDVEE
ncbi:DUF1616 domain-containing protein [Halobacteria archaeon AArc-m2/3/4]|uniref:DUF1616 domain-containing protein n=1 Tax=Natronoglomus mannanivorans TaxID=2979990 RepID=A0AAP2Z1M7_9EURY|nr:DUF1616 domain-containing protein [Halobacteria archaeon AArc-xg1-1]MCU4974912.1 DUF1616 domain-containing protein [Halobacteria archaeon AArc-m2/3/4]